MRFAKGRMGVLGALLAVLVPAASLAQTKVEVQADVVLASNSGSIIDPPELAKMKDQFMKSGLAFTSYKRLKAARLSLEQGKPSRLELPNRQTAAFTLAEVKEGTTRVDVKLAKLNTTVGLGREGSVFIQAGDHDGGKLVLVLSSGVGAPKPRRGPAVSRPGEGPVCPREAPALTAGDALAR